MPSTTAPTTIQELREQTRRKWVAWCREYNTSRTMPSARELLEAATILGRVPAGDAFEADAQAVGEHDHAADRAEGYAAIVAERAAMAPADIEGQIEALETQLRELRALRGASSAPAAAMWGERERQKADRIRKANPGLFGGGE